MTPRRRLRRVPSFESDASPASSALEPNQPPKKQDVTSVGLALTGTFILRCASYAAGLLILVSLGIKSRSESDVTAGVVSLVAVTFYASELIGAPIFGALSDRFGRKPFMMLGPIFGGIAAQLMSLTMVIPVLVLVRVLEGLSTATAAPSTLGFLSAQTAGSEKFRGRVMGFYEAATVVGLALGAAVGGKLHDQYGQTSFTIVAGIYLLSLLPFLFVRDRATAPRVRSSHHRNLLSRMLNRRIMRFAPAWLAANAVLGAWFSVGPFLAAGAPNESQFLMRGFSSGEIGTGLPGLRRPVYRGGHHLGLPDARDRPSVDAVDRCRRSWLRQSDVVGPQSCAVRRHAMRWCCPWWG